MQDAAEVKNKLLEALRGFDTLMVATNATNGTMHARPMAVAEVDEAGEVWFVTSIESDKIDEIQADSKAMVTGQNDKSFVSLSGQLDVIKDRQRIAALWKTSWNVWFDGKDDPDAVLLRLRPEIGEYWLQGGLAGVRYLFEATRALLDGTTPRDQEVIHAKVPM